MLAGPGSYDTISAIESNLLKKNPRATIGNSKRLFFGGERNIPGPDLYSAHHKMTERKSNSRERNAFNATIGNEKRLSAHDVSELTTPGPNSYHLRSLKSIGDESGVHVPIARAIRPISARPGQIKQIVMPGPQDYKVTDPNVYIKRSSVIPGCTFKREPKEGSAERTTAKSPGPQHYRVLSST